MSAGDFSQEHLYSCYRGKKDEKDVIEAERKEGHKIERRRMEFDFSKIVF